MSFAFAPAAFVQGPRDAATIRRAVDDVLSREEFGQAPPEETWFSRAWDKFVEWLDRTFGFHLGGGGAWLSYVVYAVLGLALLYVLYRVIRNLAGRERVAKAPAPGALRAARVAELLAAARAARANGDFATALRLHFWALVVGLSERGDLEYRDAWTNRELVDRGKPRAEVQRVLSALVPELDARSFGHVPATEADVEELARLCREHLGALAA